MSGDSPEIISSPGGRGSSLDVKEKRSKIELIYSAKSLTERLDTSMTASYFLLSSLTFAGVRIHVMVGLLRIESCRASTVKCFELPTVIGKLQVTKTIVDVIKARGEGVGH